MTTRYKVCMLLLAVFILLRLFKVDAIITPIIFGSFFALQLEELLDKGVER